MALTIGIVGLPNVGKSTLFNALTKNSVLAANYPFATIEPNVGVVPLPDSRLGVLSQLFASEKTVPATVSFVDIAGIVRGASEGEGLGNKFLANIREADAICQVIRVFEDDDVVHVEGKVSPEGDIETINTELILADLQTLEKAVPRLEKEARIAKDKKGALDNAVAAQAVLEKGDTLYASGAAAGVDLAEARALSLLTTKPFIYVFNLSESQLTDEALKSRLAALVAPADSVFLDAKLESDLSRSSTPRRRWSCSSRWAPEDRAWTSWRGWGSTARAADLPHRGAQGVAGVDHPPGVDRPAGGGRDPHRLPARVHQGRGGLLRRPRRGRVHERRQGGRPGPDRGQGLRHGRRRRGRVPVQRLTRRPPPGERHGMSAWQWNAIATDANPWSRENGRGCCDAYAGQVPPILSA